MKTIAEEDYINTVDDFAKDHNFEARQGWAKNVQDNNYLCLSLSNTLEYWRVLAEKEQSQLSRDKASGVGISKPPSSSKQNKVIKKQKPSFYANDSLFIANHRDSLGTMIGNYVRSFTSTNYKTSYFKSLGMNNIIDISDDSDGSHMGFFNPESMKNIQSLLKKNSDLQTPEYDCSPMEAIITKFEKIEIEDRFLEHCLTLMEDVNEVDKTVKKIYIQILEAMLYSKYLFKEDLKTTEADVIIKLHGPIYEKLFQGSNIRLIWGDTNSPFNDHSKARMDLRLTLNDSPDLSVVQFARTTKLSKYYRDKLKAVVVTLAHLKKHLQRTKMDLDLAKEVAIPFLITQGLESDLYSLRLADRDWCVVEKIADVDIPSSVAEVKDKGIEHFVKQLQITKQMSIDIKNICTSKRREAKSMHSISKKAVNITSFFKKEIWKDLFDDEDDQSSEDEL